MYYYIYIVSFTKHLFILNNHNITNSIFQLVNLQVHWAKLLVKTKQSH